MVIDRHRRLDQPRVDVGGRDVLDVAQPRRQRHAGRVARGLGGDVEIDGTLQPFARAGNLGERSSSGASSAPTSTIDMNSNACHQLLRWKGPKLIEFYAAARHGERVGRWSHFLRLSLRDAPSASRIAAAANCAIAVSPWVSHPFGPPWRERSESGSLSRCYQEFCHEDHCAYSPESLCRDRSSGCGNRRVGAVSAQQGATYEIVSSFNGIFTDGRGPWTSLIEGSDGNLYGTTLIEGRFGAGTIFRIDPAGVLTTVHHFSERDGSAPAGLIQAADGRLYGTTEFGGSSDLGTVFRLEPTGGVTTLYSFSDEDGTSQPTVLVQGSSGTIFGVTRGQFSTVFRLNPGGGITPLHRFESSEEGSTATALIEAADGNLYGAMQTLGPLGGGTIYKLDASGTLTTLHAFSGADGSGPFDLIQGHDGDFYGVTVNEATIFKMDAAGSVTTLHRFPAGTTSHVLIQASDGSFYVNTEAAIVKLDPAGTVTALHTFTGDDGRSIGALTQASDGKLYGTKLLGGTALGRRRNDLHARSGGSVCRTPSLRPEPRPRTPSRTCDRGERRAPVRHDIDWRSVRFWDRVYDRAVWRGHRPA